jgi:hypothetical protein
VEVDYAGIVLVLFVFEETGFQLQSLGGGEAEILSAAAVGDDGGTWMDGAVPRSKSL